MYVQDYVDETFFLLFLGRCLIFTRLRQIHTVIIRHSGLVPCAIGAYYAGLWEKALIM